MPIEKAKLAFLVTFKKDAARVCPTYRVPPQVCTSQSTLESGWGQFGGKFKDAKSQAEREALAHYNYFGIQGKGDAGSQLWPTREFVGIKGKGGKYVDRELPFAAYSSREAAIVAYCGFFNKPHYQRAKELFANDPTWFLTWIWAGGYATEPDYVDRVVGVMRTIIQQTGDASYDLHIDASLATILEQLKDAEGGLNRPRSHLRDTLMGQGRPPTYGEFNPAEANALFQDVIHRTTEPPSPK